MTPVHKGLVHVPHGQVHFRYGGRGPVVVLLHDSPRSSVLHVPNLEWLGEHFTVVALDTPGCGNSTPLPQAEPTIEDFADALAGTLTALGIERCALYGLHSGAQIALQFAVTHPARAALTILDGLALPARPATAGFLERCLESFEPTADGAHLARQWSRVLDFHRYFPWFDRSAATRLRVALPDDAELHAFATDLLAAGRGWSSAYAAALRHPAASAIQHLLTAVVFMCREDDVLHGDLDRLPKPLPADCSVERIPPHLPAWRTRLLALLQGAGLPRESWSPPQVAPEAGAPGGRQRYVSLVHGQVRVRLQGSAGEGVPLLMLHDVPGASCALRPLAGELSRGRLTIAPDLPGTGESHPLPYPSLGSYVTSLVETLEQLGTGPVDVFAEGLGTCFAAALAAHHPAMVRRLALDGVPMISTRERRLYARNYCPPLAPDRHGTHLLRLWQQLRDAESSWPWFERAASAARVRDPDLDPGRLNDVLVEVMKQLPSYGDAARAALEASVRDIVRAVHQPVLLFDVADDVRYAATSRVSRRLAASRVLPRPATLPGLAECLRTFLA
jgi:pimeloyl-ACP methyl ester carboxylesterase